MKISFMKEKWWLLIVALFFSFTSSSLAYTEAVTASQKAVTIATVNVQDVKLLSQKKNVFNIYFSLSNREGVQPNIVYAVDLMQKNTEGATILVDQKVYHTDITNLGPKDSSRKTIMYTAPYYLKGSYFIMIEARNIDGFVFGFSQIPEAVILNGTGENIEVSNCFLSLVGEKNNTPLKDINVSGNENLQTNCTIINKFSTTEVLTPVFETRSGSVFGNVIEVKKSNPLTLKSGEKLIFSLPLQKQTESRMYSTVLNFFNQNSQQVSPSVSFNYSIKGTSVAIQNLTLDKNYYKKDETAKISLFWVGNIDESVNVKNNIVIDVVNSEKSLCLERIAKELSVKKQFGVETFSSLVTKDCKDPTVILKITDQNGKVLMESTYKILSKNVEVGKVKSNFTYYFVVALFSICFFALFVYSLKKRLAIHVFFGLALLSGMFSFGHEAKADSFFLGNGGNVYITANINKTVYMAGETIVLTANAVEYGEAGKGNIAAFAMNGVVNGQYQTIFPTMYSVTPYGFPLNVATLYYTAPSSGGSYNAVINASGSLRFNIDTGYISYNIAHPLPYSVIPSNASFQPTASFWGPDAVNPYTWTGYGMVGTDPNNDLLLHYVDWGDGQAEWVTGWVSNGTYSWPQHYWATPGYKVITAYVMDQNSVWSEPAYLGVTVVNPAPATPAFWGPTSVNPSTWAEYGMYGTDPYGDNLLHYVNWGDGQAGWTTGWLPNGSYSWPQHYWATPGYKIITAYTYDMYGAWSPPFYYGVTVLNPPPAAPTFWGATSVMQNTNASYGMVSTDPYGDNLIYYIDWGDGQAGWATGWIASGTYIWPTHAWATAGNKIITAYSYDMYGAWSPPTYLGVTVVNAPLNGSCGTANTHVFPYSSTTYPPYTQCYAGTSSNTAFPAVGSTASWNCVGLYGGTNVSCSASRQSAPQNGLCGTANGHVFTSSDTGYSPYTQCGAGSSSNTAFPVNGATSSWSCLGQGGGTNAFCSASRQLMPVNGVCGSANNKISTRTPASSSLCSSGMAGVVTKTGGVWQWSCAGKNGGSNSPKCATKKFQVDFTPI